jgi:hypothetical protein
MRRKEQKVKKMYNDMIKARQTNDDGSMAMDDERSVSRPESANQKLK